MTTTLTIQKLHSLAHRALAHLTTAQENLRPYLDDNRISLYAIDQLLAAQAAYEPWAAVTEIDEDGTIRASDEDLADNVRHERRTQARRLRTHRTTGTGALTDLQEQHADNAARQFLDSTDFLAA